MGEITKNMGIELVFNVITNIDSIAHMLSEHSDTVLEDVLNPGSSTGTLKDVTKITIYK